MTVTETWVHHYAQRSVSPGNVTKLCLGREGRNVKKPGFSRKIRGYILGDTGTIDDSEHYIATLKKQLNRVLKIRNFSAI